MRKCKVFYSFVDTNATQTRHKANIKLTQKRHKTNVHKMMTKRELKSLRKNLPIKYRKILSAKLELHPNTIYRVLIGDFYNEAVITEAILLAKTSNKKKESATKKIKEL